MATWDANFEASPDGDDNHQGEGCQQAEPQAAYHGSSAANSA